MLEIREAGRRVSWQPTVTGNGNSVKLIELNPVKPIYVSRRRVLCPPDRAHNDDHRFIRTEHKERVSELS